MPVQREEQARIRLQLMPNGDTASARGTDLCARVVSCYLLRTNEYMVSPAATRTYWRPSSKYVSGAFVITPR